jgi:hypothetical protein
LDLVVENELHAKAQNITIVTAKTNGFAICVNMSSSPFINMGGNFNVMQGLPFLRSSAAQRQSVDRPGLHALGAYLCGFHHIAGCEARVNLSPGQGRLKRLWIALFVQLLGIRTSNGYDAKMVALPVHLKD